MTRAMRSAFYAAALFTGTLQAQAPSLAIEVDARSLQPGELMKVTVAAPPQATSVAVTMAGHRTVAFKYRDRWTALVGLDLDQRAGSAPLQASATDGSATWHGERRLTITAKQFATRTLTVAPDFVNPPPEQQKRIEADSALLEKVYNSSATSPLWRDPFIRPVAEAANSRFGTRSVYNGERRSPHAGADFLSPAGTPVKAPNAGRVVVARDLFFSGNTVIIDHGMEMFSTLAHLSAMDVKEGESVTAGRVIGRVGATGRVTGPHLHWAVRVAGARVDPLSLLAVLGPARR